MSHLLQCDKPLVNDYTVEEDHHSQMWMLAQIKPNRMSSRYVQNPPLMCGTPHNDCWSREGIHRGKEMEWPLSCNHLMLQVLQSKCSRVITKSKAVENSALQLYIHTCAFYMHTHVQQNVRIIILCFDYRIHTVTVRRKWISFIDSLRLYFNTVCTYSGVYTVVQQTLRTLI